MCRITMPLAFALAVVTACSRDEPLPARGAQWDQVVAWAEPTVAPGDPALLEHALALFEPHRAELDDALRPAAAGAVVRVDADALDPQVGEALDAFVGWYEGRDGLPRVACDADFAKATKQLFPMFQLAKLALATAPDDAADIHVAAVLYLGHRLRSEGTTLLHAMIGAAIADEAVAWARARKLGPSQPFRDWAPAPTFYRRAFATEAACSVALVETLRDTELSPEQVLQDVGAVLPGVDIGKADIARQVERVRALHEGNVHLIARLWSAPDALAAHLEARSTVARAEWSPPLVRVITVPWPHLASELRKTGTNYAAFLR